MLPLLENTCCRLGRSFVVSFLVPDVVAARTNSIARRRLYQFRSAAAQCSLLVNTVCSSAMMVSEANCSSISSRQLCFAFHFSLGLCSHFERDRRQAMETSTADRGTERPRRLSNVRWKREPTQLTVFQIQSCNWTLHVSTGDSPRVTDFVVHLILNGLMVSSWRLQCYIVFHHDGDGIINAAAAATGAETHLHILRYFGRKTRVSLRTKQEACHLDQPKPRRRCR